MTAYNNGYFNAKVSMKENENSFEIDLEDNFVEILPIFKYPDETTAQSSAPLNYKIHQAESPPGSKSLN